MVWRKVPVPIRGRATAGLRGTAVQNHRCLSKQTKPRIPSTGTTKPTLILYLLPNLFLFAFLPTNLCQSLQNQEHSFGFVHASMIFPSLCSSCQLHCSRCSLTSFCSQLTFYDAINRLLSGICCLGGMAVSALDDKNTFDPHFPRPWDTATFEIGFHAFEQGNCIWNPKLK